MAAPMPGLEAGDISVNISGAAVTIRGEERGAGQHERDLLLEEWSIGPYYREVSLPQAVDGSLANATYGKWGPRPLDAQVKARAQSDAGRFPAPRDRHRTR